MLISCVCIRNAFENNLLLLIYFAKSRLLSYVSYISLHDALQVQDMLEKRKTRTREALALMWCAGQLPEKNLAHGLRGLLLLDMHR